MSIELSNYIGNIKNTVVKILSLVTLTVLITFFYFNSQPVSKKFEAEILIELGSLDRTMIDGIEVLEALSTKYNTISLRKLNNHEHYIYVSSISNTEKEANLNLNEYVNFVLEKHKSMYEKRKAEVQSNIDFIDTQLSRIPASQTNSGLVLRLVELNELINTFSSTRIIKRNEIMDATNQISKGLVIAIGFVIGVLLSTFIFLLNYTFYSKKKV